MKKFILSAFLILSITSAFAGPNPAKRALERISYDMQFGDDVESFLNTSLMATVGPFLSVGSVVTGSSNVISGTSAAKEAFIQKAAPSAVDFIENGVASEDFLAAAIIILDEKIAEEGEDSVNAQIDQGDVNLKSLALEIVTR